MTLQYEIQKIIGIKDIKNRTTSSLFDQPNAQKHSARIIFNETLLLRHARNWILFHE